jgi:hypothetical protein
MGKLASYLMTWRRSTDRENAKLTHAQKQSHQLCLFHASLGGPVLHVSGQATEDIR